MPADLLHIDKRQAIKLLLAKEDIKEFENMQCKANISDEEIKKLYPKYPTCFIKYILMNMNKYHANLIPQATFVDLINCIQGKVTIPDCLTQTKPYTSTGDMNMFHTENKPWFFKIKSQIKEPSWKTFIKNRIIPLINYDRKLTSTQPVT